MIYEELYLNFVGFAQNQNFTLGMMATFIISIDQTLSIELSPASDIFSS